jgi:hypothetical protein
MIKFLLLAPLLLVANDYTEMSNTWDEGVDAAKSQRNYITSDMDGKINSPGTSKSDFITTDGTSFRANIQCKSSQNEPWATVDYNLVSGGNISAYVSGGVSFASGAVDTVCTNGFGKNDVYYRLSYNSGLSMYEVERKELGGCYCISGICGGLAENSKKRVLDTVGGAIVSALSSSVKTTSVKNDGNKYYIYREDPSCNNGGGSMPNSSMNYDSEMANQMANPNSPYSAVTKGATNYATNPASDTDTTAMKEISRESASSAEYEKGSMTVTYNRKFVKDDTWHQEDNRDAVIYNKSTEEIKFCEVGFNSTNPHTFTDGTNRSQTPGTSTQKESEIRECTGANSDICPVDSSKGEYIIHDCGDINDFAKVLGAFAAMEEMTKDMICGE